MILTRETILLSLVAPLLKSSHNFFFLIGLVFFFQNSEQNTTNHSKDKMLHFCFMLAYDRTNTLLQTIE